MSLPFNVTAVDRASRARRGTLTTAHGVVDTPAFMTVGTRATVTGLTPADLRACGITDRHLQELCDLAHALKASG